MVKSRTATTAAARLRVPATRMIVDLVTAETVTALRGQGIPSIVLKGPAHVHWLYDDEDDRRYNDSDLLVPPDEFDRAAAVLESLGFEKVFDEADLPGARRLHAHHWKRPGHPAEVDLHRTVLGASAAPAEVWAALREHATKLAVAGVEVEAPDRAATACLVALHAAQHGLVGPTLRNDLARALERFDLETWRSASALAARLQATPALATGLELDPRGGTVAAALELPDRRPYEIALSALAPARGAPALHGLLTAGGARRKLAMLARLFVPSTGLMRYQSRLARRGRLGLLAAYAWRQLVLLYRIGPAVRSLWLARRIAR